MLGMMLKTNFENIKRLDKQYRPKQRGVIYADEKVMIREELQLEQMDYIGLCNLNDFVKMYYTLLRDSTKDIEQQLYLRNKESSITFVIELAIMRYKAA